MLERPFFLVAVLIALTVIGMLLLRNMRVRNTRQATKVAHSRSAWPIH